MGSAAATTSKFPDLQIDRDSGVALYQQLEDALRSTIDAGSLAPGQRLPSIQELAVQLCLSRNTVRRAFQALAASGHLDGTAQSGFRVRADRLEPAAHPPAAIEFDRPAALDRVDSARLEPAGAARPFRPAAPEPNQFPFATWEALRAQVLRHPMQLLPQCGPLGYLPLREAIANRLRGARGLTATADQVIITAGAQPALHLVIQTLISPGDLAGVEEPGLYAAKALFEHAGARVLPLLVDEEGLVVPEARRQRPPAAIYTTPAHQFPLGARLTPARRTALLEFARHAGTWIIEADTGSEFSYHGQSPPCLQGADDHGRVVYLGAFDTTLFPALQVGFVVAPTAVLERCSKAAALFAAQPSAFDQATLERFIRTGHFDEHLGRLNALYFARMRALAESVDSELHDFIDLEPAQAGLHAVGWLKRGIDEQLVASCASRAGLELPLLSQFGRTALLRPGVLFGFAGFRERQIRQSVSNLRRALHAATRPGLVSRLLHRG